MNSALRNSLSLLLCLFALGWSLSPAFAQGSVPPPAKIQWKNPAAPALPLAKQAAVSTGVQRHVVLQFKQIPDASLTKKLAASGTVLLDYLGANAYFALLTPSTTAQTSLASAGQVAISDILPDWKLHPDIASDQWPTWAQTSAAIQDGRIAMDVDGAKSAVVALYAVFHKDVDLQTTGRNLIESHGGTVRDEVPSVNALVAWLPKSALSAVAAEDAVQWLEPPLPPMTANNDSNRVITQVDQVQQAPYGLSGANVNVLVYDAGTARATHSDFGGRLTARDSSGMIDHATHVSGTIGGDGTASSGLYHGMAPGVTIQSYGFDYDGTGVFLYTNPGDTNADYNEAINTYGAELSNNSIGSNIANNGFPCEYEGDYGVMCSLIDEIVRGGLGSPMRIVWSNGNENGHGCGSGYHLTPPPATAKNHITVGAVNSNDDSMTSFSSWGPTDDGRIKPDVVGPGCQNNDDFGVTSCFSDSDTAYGVMCGTSMSGPTVTGICALILEDWKALHPLAPLPRNSTMKILLAHNAVDLGNPGPDFVYGFGSVRAKDTIDFLRSHTAMEASIGQSEEAQYFISVPPGTPQLKVSMAWDDYPGTLNTVTELVNDLDLELIAPDGTTHYPWTLNPTTGQEGLAAVRTQADHVNNIEQVLVDAPDAGLWKIRIIGFAVPQGPQPFSIVASPDLSNASAAGVLGLSRGAYRCEDLAQLTVVDLNLNANPSLTEQTIVQISSNSDIGELVVLTEEGLDSPVFHGSISVSLSNSAGVLLVANSDTITATYLDNNDGTGHAAIVTSTATVDCTPAVISAVSSSNLTPHTAKIDFTTDENCSSLVKYGIDCLTQNQSVPGSGGKTTHTITLSGLTPETAYYFSAGATDEAGNLATNDNGGLCYTFTTPRQPDYFTEVFTNDNDLSHSVLDFAPNGSPDFYEVCHFNADTFPVNPADGAQIYLGDEDFAEISLTAGNAVSLYGTSYSSIFVGSNGYITFGSGSNNFEPTPFYHFSRPRISACFSDLDPPGGFYYPGGTVTFQELADKIVVSFVDVPQFNSGEANSFQYELFFDSSATPGRITLTYGTIRIKGGLAGLSQGIGVPDFFVESDLTAYPECGILTVEPLAPTEIAGPVTGPFSPATYDYTLTNTSAVSLDWAMFMSDYWVDASSYGGTLGAGASEVVTMTVNTLADQLQQGFYTNDVQFSNTADSYIKLRPVHLAVNSQMSVEPDTDYTPSGYFGGPFSPDEQTYTVHNLGTSPIDFELYPDAPWVVTSLPGGTLLGGESLDVAVSLYSSVTGFPLGLHDSTISFFNITTGMNPIARHVMLTVEEPIALAPETPWSISGYHGGPFTPPTTTYTLTNQSAVAVDFSVNTGASWVTATPSSGHLESGQSLDVALGLDPLTNGMLPGSYSTEISFQNQTTNSVAATASVALDILEPLGITPPDPLESAGYEGGPFVPDTIAYTLTNAGPNPVNWAAVPSQTWLSAVPSGGTLDSGASETVTVSLIATTLPAGVYHDIIAIGNLDTAYLETRDINLEVYQRGGTVALTDSIPAPDDALMPFGQTILEMPRTEHITLTNTDGTVPVEIYRAGIQDLVMPLETGSPVSAVHIPAAARPKTEDTTPPSIGPAPSVLSPSATAASGVLLDAGSPAYGVNWTSGGGLFSQFTLDNPAAVVEIGPTEIAPAGDFDNSGDFNSMYAISYSTKHLLQIDTATGNYTDLGALTPTSGESFTGMAMDPTTGTMYASSTDVMHSTLYEIDLVTPAAIPIGVGSTSHPAIIDIAVNASGQMYGLCIVTDELVTIDKTTGETTTVGYVGFNANYAQGMDFDGSTDILYLAAFSDAAAGELRIADVVTGATSLVGAFPAGVQTTCFGIAVPGRQDFRIPNAPEWPYILQPGESLTLDVEFAPVKPGDYSGTVVVTTDDPSASRLEVGLTGTGVSDNLSVTPDTQLVAEGVLGGPFTPASIDYTILNSGLVDQNWSATASEPWVELSLPGGILAPSATATLTLSFNAQANALLPGTYTSTVTLTNTDSGHTVIRSVSLTVNEPLKVEPLDSYHGIGLVGGPFTPANITYTLSNLGGISLDWTAEGQDPWVDAVPPSGTLAAGASTTVSVGPNALANALAPGYHWSYISFTDVLTTNEVFRVASLSVSDPLTLNSMGNTYISGPQGGPFTSSSFDYMIQNNSAVDAQWYLESSAAWLDMMPSSGVLAGMGVVSAQATLNAVASALPIGIYQTQVVLRNAAGQTIGYSQITLEITTFAGCGQSDISAELLDSDPAWSTEGEWAFGVPQGLGGLPNGSSGNPDPTSGFTGTNVYGVNLSGDYAANVGGPYYLTAGPFDCSTQSNVWLFYQRWLNIDSNYLATATVEVSPDGIQWIPIWKNPTSEIIDTNWTLQTLDISPVADNNPSVYLRWGYEILPFASPFSGWNIDDIRLVSVTPSPLQVTPKGETVFTGGEGGTFAPASSSYTLRNIGAVSLDWNAQSWGPWFELSSTGGTLAPGEELVVDVTTTPIAQTLPQGSYSGALVFGNTACPVTESRDVYLQVSDPLGLTPNEDWWVTGPFGGEFSSVSKTYTLTNLGQVNLLNWSALEDFGGEYITLDPVSGTLLPGESVNVTVTLATGYETLNPSTYMSGFAFKNTDTGAEVWHTLILEISEPLSVTPDNEWETYGFSGGPFPQTSRNYTLTNASQNSVEFQASSSTPWLDVTPLNVTVPSGTSTDITLSLNDSVHNLLPGTYTGTVLGKDVTTGTEFPLQVSLEVYQPLTVSPAEGLSAEGFSGGPFTPSSVEYILTNPSSGPVVWSTQSVAAWVEIVPDSGTLLPGEIVTVSVQIGAAANSLLPGYYSGVVDFTNDTLGHTQSRDISLSVLAGPPVMRVEPRASLDIELHSGETLEVDPAFEIFNDGMSDLHYRTRVTDTSSGGNQANVQAAVAAMIARSGILSHPITVHAGQSILPRTDTSGDIVLSKPEDLVQVISAAPMPAAYNVAVLGADDISWLMDVGQKLYDTGRFDNLTLINAAAFTPTFSDLAAFDAILVFSDYAYQDSVALGDALADYVDAGGGVVCAMFELANINPSVYQLGGRWAQGDYAMMPADSAMFAPQTTLGQVYDAAHPIMANVSVFDGGDLSCRPMVQEPSANADRIADWSDGTPLVTVSNIGLPRADLAFYPVSGDAYPGLWDSSTDGATLMANALEWVTTVQGPWLRVKAPTVGTIRGKGMSENKGLIFDASDRLPGLYTGSVEVTGDDPATPSVELPCTLTILPDQLSISPETGLTTVGLGGGPFLPNSITYTLMNVGDAPIDWSVDTGMTPWLDLSVTAGSLQPGESADVVLSVNSTANTLMPAVYEATLEFIDITHGRVRDRAVKLEVTAEALIVSPDTDLSFEGTEGGPFAPGSYSYTLTNASNKPLHWRASTDFDLFAATPDTGTLDPGASVSVEVVLNDVMASLLSPSLYGDTLSFADLTNFKAQTRNGLLEVRSLTTLVWDPVMDQTAEVPFAVHLAALDSKGEVSTGFTGAASLTAFKRGGPNESRVVISEIDPNGPNSIEIENVSGDAVDTTGWAVALGTDWMDINVVAPVLWMLPSTMAADEVLYRTDDISDSGHYWGATKDWFPVGPGWAMIVDSHGFVVDFVAWGWQEMELLSLFVDVNGTSISLSTEWSGSGAIANPATSTLQRVGSEDTNTASDFSWEATPSIGTANANLLLPYALPDNSVPVSPNTTGNFVQGIWDGSVTIQEVCDKVALFADAGSGLTSFTNPFQVGLPPVTVLNVTSSLADGAYPSGQQVEVLVQFSDPVLVVGLPTLSLNVGHRALYEGGSGTDTLSFLYTVQDGDDADPLDIESESALNPNGFALHAIDGRTVDITLPEPATPGSLSENNTIVIDTTPPVARCKDATIGLDALGSAAITPELIDNGSSDNHSVADSSTDVLSVGCAEIGDNPVTLTVTDAAGNQSTCQATVTVTEDVPPVLSLVGAPEVSVPLMETYTDAGATALDNCSGDITGSINTVNPVDTAVVGHYTVTYNVTDAAGNPALEATRTVHVVDVTAPVISLLGNPEETVSLHGAYADAGATAVDNYDGDITAHIVVANPVNTSVTGNYTVTYDVKDAANNPALQVSRIVHVVDTTAPTIQVLGNLNITMEVHGTYLDAGATASDDYDGDITARIEVTNPVNTDVVGNYKVLYDVKDIAGNPAIQTTRAVHVVDTTLPIITLLGSDSVSVEGKSVYTDAGATASDNYDGDLTASIETVNPVNTATLGDYTVTYNVKDSNGNSALPVTRLVKVEDTVAPVITLLGAASLNIEVNSTYLDAGATALDAFDGDITGNINTVNPVNTANVGHYTVTYNVSDAAGHAATQVTRTVNVMSGLHLITPVNASTIHVDPAADTAAIVLTAEGPDTIESVTYRIDGNMLGVTYAPSFSMVATLDLQTLGLGVHELTATPSVSGVKGPAETASFTIAAIQPSEDTDENGIPDNPFDVLVANGDLWSRDVVPVATGNPRTVLVARLDGQPALDRSGIPLMLAVPGKTVINAWTMVDVPRALVPEGSIAILLISVADDLDTLFGADVTTALGPEPDGSQLIENGRYAEISLLISTDNGATYNELDNTLLQADPLRIEMTGLVFSGNTLPVLYSHPTIVYSNPASGPFFESEAGSWSPDHILNQLISGDSLQGILTELSVFAPLEFVQIVVPNVTGLPRASAETALTAAGLTVGTLTDAFSTTLTAGAVISQNPLAGENVAPGSSVALVVSKGPQSVDVPNIAGMTRTGAQSALTLVGLTVGITTEAYSDTVPRGAVIGQIPTAGTAVAPGTAINFAISKGPEPTISEGEGEGEGEGTTQKRAGCGASDAPADSLGADFILIAAVLLLLVTSARNRRIDQA